MKSMTYNNNDNSNIHNNNDDNKDNDISEQHLEVTTVGSIYRLPSQQRVRSEWILAIGV